MFVRTASCKMKRRGPEGRAMAPEGALRGEALEGLPPLGKGLQGPRPPGSLAGCVFLNPRQRKEETWLPSIN